MVEDFILEGNKLIAEFMGKEFVHMSFENRTSWISARFDNSAVFNSFDCYTEIPYHKSFDWLMSVVEKIESLTYKELSIYSSVNFRRQKHIDIYWCAEGTKELSGGTTSPCRISSQKGKNELEILYMVVLDFIKWYNKENKTL
jgi:hypothetical protein